MSATLHAAPNGFGHGRGLTALLLSLALLLTPTAWRPAAAQSDTLSGTVQATAEDSPGLRQTTFSTSLGTLTVNLPDEMAAGDSLTGTVVARPSGNTDAERAKNRAALEKLSVNVGGELISAARETFRLVIPGDGTKTAVEVALRNNKGRELSRLDAPVLPEPPRNAPADFEFPSLVQQGRAGLVRGPFNGDIAGTDQVKLGGERMKQLVESPRSMVFSNTSKTIGPAPLELNEQGRVLTAEVASVGVQLSAPKLNLQNGETTTLTVRVMGLARASEPATLSLKNLSPGVITLSGGNSQTIIIRPPDVQPDGVYRAEFRLTGVQPGGFSITATLTPPARRADAGDAVSSLRRGQDAPTPAPSQTPAPSTTPPPSKERPGAPKDETTGGEKVETSAPATAARPLSALKSAAPSAAAVNYDVGIIPGPGGACPCGSQLVAIHMDDEDKNNANSQSGWVGGIQQTRNTLFKFCRVSGTQFTRPAKSAYALLQLGWECPRDSVPFARYFDNEDNGNINSYSGDIGPNQSSVANSSTLLNFCLFSSRFNPGGTPAVFPDLGVEYGVFAPGDLPGALASGYVYTDDEDNWNENWMTFDPSIAENDTTPLISGGRNTLLRVVKVKSAPPIGKLHSLTLSPSSVKGGSNGTQPTLMVHLDAPAPPCGQDIYLSSNTPGVAWIKGGDRRTIPGGKSSLAIVGFLGTRNVIFNRHVTISVSVNGKVGYAGLTVKK